MFSPTTKVDAGVLWSLGMFERHHMLPAMMNVRRAQSNGAEDYSTWNKEHHYPSTRMLSSDPSLLALLKKTSMLSTLMMQTGHQVATAILVTPARSESLVQ